MTTKGVATSDVCENARHAPIAFAFNGTDIRCPVCTLLDQLAEYETEDDRLEHFKELKIELESSLDTAEKKIQLMKMLFKADN